MAILQATDDNFKSLVETGVSIVDFYSTHCGPCRALLPKLMQVETELPFINLVKVNTDDCPKLAGEFKIELLPTIYLCKDGSMKEYNGLAEVDDIRSALGELLYE